MHLSGTRQQADTRTKRVSFPEVQAKPDEPDDRCVQLEAKHIRRIGEHGRWGRLYYLPKKVGLCIERQNGASLFVGWTTQAEASHTTRTQVP